MLTLMPNEKSNSTRWGANRLLYFVVIFLLTTLFLWLQFFPLPTALQHNQYARVLLSSDGALLSAQIARDHQWRFAPVETLPEKYRLSVLTFEDKNFYHHFGIDPTAIGCALLRTRTSIVPSAAVGRWPSSGLEPCMRRDGPCDGYAARPPSEAGGLS